MVEEWWFNGGLIVVYWALMRFNNLSLRFHLDFTGDGIS